MDIVPPKTRSRMMAAVRQRDTSPEMVVRRLVHSMGHRYRLHVRDLPGTPDLVLPGSGKIILVHGCFWHRHRCRKATTPKTREKFWKEKFEANIARDRRQVRALRKGGWDVLVVWECQTHRVEWLTQQLMTFLSPD